MEMGGKAMVGWPRSRERSMPTVWGRWLAAGLLLGVLYGAAAGQPPNAGGTVQIRPGAQEGPTTVGVFIWVIDIDDIDTAAETFVLNVFVALRWTDPRLAHEEKDGVINYDTSQVWHPKIQIANEIGLVRRTLPERVAVLPSGEAIYRQRFVGPLAQPLRLEDFPFDEHTFQMHLVSPGSSPNEISFVADTSMISQGLDRAAGIGDNVSLPDWKIVSWDVGPRRTRAYRKYRRRGTRCSFTRPESGRTTSSKWLYRWF